MKTDWTWKSMRWAKNKDGRMVAHTTFEANIVVSVEVEGIEEPTTRPEDHYKADSDVS